MIKQFKQSVIERINTCEKGFDTLEDAKKYFSLLVKLNPFDGRNDGAVYIARACLNRINKLIEG